MMAQTHSGSNNHGAAENHDIIEVMLVDDSSVIRAALAQILEEDPGIKVIASVANGQLALSALNRYVPDIIILDIEMPVMDGITALPQLLEKSPSSKVVMFSTLTEKGADITLKALSLGAVECVVKPASGDARKGGEFQGKLISLLKNLCPKKHAKASASSPHTTPASAKAPVSAKPSSAIAPGSAKLAAWVDDGTPVQLRKNFADYQGKPDILAIGSSTGGPQALFEVLKKFTNFDVPIVVTQHMPPTFTKILANHIQQNTGVEAFEGEEGMRLERGKIYVAPGGYHMLFERKGIDVVIHLDEGPQENFCRPAVDPMFRSLIAIYGQKVFGIILTGMGNDGLQGCQNLVDIGGRMIAQDEDSSVVWGMPGAVARAGICTEVLPLEQVGPWVRKEIMRL